MTAIMNAELVMRDHLIPEAVLFIEDGKIVGYDSMSNAKGANVMLHQGARICVNRKTYPYTFVRLWTNHLWNNRHILFLNY